MVKHKRKKHRLFWLVIKIQIPLVFILLGVILYYNYADDIRKIKNYRDYAIALVKETDEQQFVPARTSIIYDAQGTVISYVKGEKYADYVKYGDIPMDFVRAMISIEDKKFYSHKGVDYGALIRAAKAIAESKTLSQGGSTITMQLARNIYLDSGKTMERKFKEMFVAMELEKKYNKNEIMEFYLNNIYFANGYYGIKAACEGYFSCDLNELSLSQVAFLCGIPNSPSYYDPFVHIENTINRRNRILENMYQDGCITKTEYVDAIEEEIRLVPSEQKKSQRNNYIDTYVYYCAIRVLMENEGFVFQESFSSEEEKRKYYEEYDLLYLECQKKLFMEGYEIYTSIDLTKQELLQNAVDENLAQFTETDENGIYQLQASAVTIDNETGYVVAIVGGREQELGIYTLNRAFQSYRQPGSSIKPLIVYTPFFERGNTPDTLVVDEKIQDGPKGSYYYGEVTTRFAVEKSLNSVAWKIYENLSPQTGLQYLKNMKFSAIQKEDEVLATALGGFTHGVSAVEMAAGFSTIEHDGLYRTPSCIKKILDADKNVVYEDHRPEIRIYKETAARMMTDVLETAIETGTGKMAYIEHMPCAGKTGTTNDNKDGWFVGYTRYYTTSVWVGYDIPKPIDGLQGGTYPSQIWKAYMEQIHKDLVPLKFLPYAKLSEEFIEEYYPEETEEESSQDIDEHAEPENVEPEHAEPENVEPENVMQENLDNEQENDIILEE